MLGAGFSILDTGCLMLDIRYLSDDSQDSPFLSHPPWSLPEFIPGCTYTALLPGDVSTLAFLVYPEFIPESPPLDSQQGNVSSLAFFSLPPRTTPLTYCRGSGAGGPPSSRIQQPCPGVPGSSTETPLTYPNHPYHHTHTPPYIANSPHKSQRPIIFRAFLSHLN